MEGAAETQAKAPVTPALLPISGCSYGFIWNPISTVRSAEQSTIVVLVTRLSVSGNETPGVPCVPLVPLRLVTGCHSGRPPAWRKRRGRGGDHARRLGDGDGEDGGAGQQAGVVSSWLSAP